MDANKENPRRKITTRIPVPLKPLPALPTHLLNRKKRAPLKTIQQTNVLSSTSNGTITNEKPSANKNKIKDQHVTLRVNNENLDWNYKVFRDQNESVITISDDEDTSNFAGNRDQNCLDTRQAITPVEKSVQHKQVKNIKRSLKRPHSRELQGLSPDAEKDKRQDDKAKRRLEFHGSVQDTVETSDYWNVSYTIALERDYSYQMFNYLLETENPPKSVPTLPEIHRACVINWLMRVNGPLGNPAILQTACWYLDSILGSASVEVGELQLQAAACYWIARKIHGSLIKAARLVRCANNAFTQEMLLSNEKKIMLKLDFPAQPVIPHDFISYLAWWCDKENPGPIEMAATFLCLSGMMVSKELCCEYPSALACAAVRSAVILLRKTYLMTQLEKSPIYQSGKNKAVNQSYTCSILRRSVMIVGDPQYDYKAPLEHYGSRPSFIAQQIIESVRQCVSCAYPGHS